jgi:hypothetical protein
MELVHFGQLVPQLCKDLYLVALGRSHPNEVLTEGKMDNVERSRDSSGRQSKNTDNLSNSEGSKLLQVSQFLTSLVLVLCREYTVRAFLMPLVTNSASMPVLRVPNGGFIRIVSKPVHEGGETRINETATFF